MPRVQAGKQRFRARGGPTGKLHACYEALLAGAAGECLAGELGCCGDSCCSAAAVSRALCEYCSHSDAAREAFVASNGLGAMQLALLRGSASVAAAAARVLGSLCGSPHGLQCLLSWQRSAGCDLLAALAGAAAGASLPPDLRAEAVDALRAALGALHAPAAGGGMDLEAALLQARAAAGPATAGGDPAAAKAPRPAAAAAAAAVGQGDLLGSLALPALLSPNLHLRAAGARLVAHAAEEEGLLHGGAAGAAAQLGAVLGLAPQAALASPPLGRALGAAGCHGKEEAAPLGGSVAGGSARVLALCELACALVRSPQAFKVLRELHGPHHVLRLCSAALLPPGLPLDRTGREALLDALLVCLRPDPWLAASSNAQGALADLRALAAGTANLAAELLTGAQAGDAGPLPGGWGEGHGGLDAYVQQRAAGVALASAAAGLPSAVVWHPETHHGAVDALLRGLRAVLAAHAAGLHAQQPVTLEHDGAATSSDSAGEAEKLYACSRLSPLWGDAEGYNAAAAAAAAVRLLSVQGGCERDVAATACVAEWLGAVRACTQPDAAVTLAAPLLAALRQLPAAELQQLHLLPCGGACLLAAVVSTVAALAEALLTELAQQLPLVATAHEACTYEGGARDDSTSWAQQRTDGAWGERRSRRGGRARATGELSHAECCTLVDALHVWARCLELAAAACTCGRASSALGAAGPDASNADSSSSSSSSSCLVAAVRPAATLRMVLHAAERLLRVSPHGGGDACGRDTLRPAASSAAYTQEGWGADVRGGFAEWGARDALRHDVLEAIGHVLAAAAAAPNPGCSHAAFSWGEASDAERGAHVQQALQAVAVAGAGAGAGALAAGGAGARQEGGGWFEHAPHEAALRGQGGRGVCPAGTAVGHVAGPVGRAWMGGAVAEGAAASRTSNILAAQEAATQGADDLADAEAILNDCLACIARQDAQRPVGASSAWAAEGPW